MKIPFNKVSIGDKSKLNLQRAIESDHLHGDGSFAQQATNSLRKIVGSDEVFLTPSCTSALGIASILLDLEKGDEVILPSFTFTSAAVVVANYGATPVFVDVDEKSLCMNVEQAEAAITSRTKAISWVNYGGAIPDVVKIKALAKTNGLFLIEDNAHGLGTNSELGTLGTFGDVSTQSFHATKNINCGEGGAISINNKELRNRIEIIREKGTNRAEFVRGEINKYQWIDKGGSELLAEPLAAILSGELEEFAILEKKRAKIWNNYSDSLEDWARNNNIRILHQDTYQKTHLFALLLPTSEARSTLLDSCAKAGITTTFHYQTLHDSIAGEKYGRSTFTYENSRFAANNLIRLPIWSRNFEEKQEYVIDTILKTTVN